MNLDSLPNELIMRICLQLPLESFLNCKFANKKLHEIITYICEKKYKVWHRGARSPGREVNDKTRLVQSGDVILFGDAKSMDIYEYSQLSPHLYRTIVNDDVTIESFHSLGMIPDSTTIVLSSGLIDDSLNIYDLRKGIALYKAESPTIPGFLPISIVCSTHAIAMTLMNFEENHSFQTRLYEWDGTTAREIQVLPQRRSAPSVPSALPDLSGNGILAYRPDDRPQVCFFNAHTNTAIGEMAVEFDFGARKVDLADLIMARTLLGEIAIEFDFDLMKLNADGTLLALWQFEAGQLAIYSIHNKTKLFEYGYNLVPLFLDPLAFSDDFNFILFGHFQKPGCSIVHLKEEADASLSLKFISKLNFDKFHAPLFRNIRNELYLQFVESKSYILRIFKLNETTLEWELPLDEE